MTVALRDASIGLDAYERLCEEAPEGERLEFLDGRVVRMMVGGSTAHHALTRRLDNLIAERLPPGGPCASFRETMRLRAGTARFYPDIFVACGAEVGPDPDTRDVSSAVVIVEVLSPSTERYDRGSKWLKYQALPDLRHFVLVAQDQRRIEAFHRQGAGWHYELLQGPDAVLHLAAIGVALRLDAIYAAVPMLAFEAGERAERVAFTPAQASGLARMRGFSSSGAIDILLAEMDAEECEAAVAAIVGLVGAPDRTAWRSVLPERLHGRLDAILGAGPDDAGAGDSG